jgi:UTP--glucose-1-phosphate uridylyltransferase
LQPEIFSEIEKVKPGSGGEIQITDAMIALSKYQPFYGLKFEGTTYDCGDKLGFLSANVAFALEREDLGDAFRAVLADIIAKHGGFLSWNGNSELAKVLQEIRAGSEIKETGEIRSENAVG